jgi:hypothetical protein
LGKLLSTATTTSRDRWLWFGIGKSGGYARPGWAAGGRGGAGWHQYFAIFTADATQDGARLADATGDKP